jgi:hypothetical protein
MIVLLMILGFTVDQAILDSAMEIMRSHYTDADYKGPIKKIDNDVLCHLADVESYGLIHWGRDDLVIGDEPAETLQVSGYFYNHGNIIVINDGVLNIDHADFNLEGNIYVVNYGKVVIDSSTCAFLQHYIYHYIILITDSAEFNMTHSTTFFNGYPINIGVQGAGRFSMEQVINHDWITAVVSEYAQASLEHVDHTGEWLFINSCNAVFTHVDTLLTWYFFEDSTIVDLVFPDTDTVYGFYMDSTLSNVQGIKYHVEIDSSTGCMWAAIPLAGSDVIIRDSELRVTGIMFEGIDSFTVEGLVNGLHYNDYVLPVTDRVYHLLNTTVQTWNLYPNDSAYVELSSSIFGELCGFGDSYTVIQNAFCDGSGGHIEASNNGLVLVFLSSICADVITKNRGICLLAYCSMPLGNIWAAGASVLVCVNTQFPEDPVPSDTAVVFCAAVSGPSNAYVDDSVDIQGSAWIDTGPDNSMDFESYQVHYRYVGDSTWIPVGNAKYTEIRDNTLDSWDTYGLTPGVYEIRLVLKDTEDDSVEALKQIRLRTPSVDEQTGCTLYTEYITITRCAPRLFHIFCTLQQPDIVIYDAVGRSVFQATSNETFWQIPACGVYFVTERSNGLTYKVIGF